MSKQYVPTTEQVRDAFSYDPEYEYHHPDNPGYHYANRAVFDRWLARVKAEARVEALREAATDAGAETTKWAWVARSVADWLSARATREMEEAS